MVGAPGVVPAPSGQCGVAPFAALVAPPPAASERAGSSPHATRAEASTGRTRTAAAKRRAGRGEANTLRDPTESPANARSRLSGLAVVEVGELAAGGAVVDV